MVCRDIDHKYIIIKWDGSITVRLSKRWTAKQMQDIYLNSLRSCAIKSQKITVFFLGIQFYMKKGLKFSNDHEYISVELHHVYYWRRSQRSRSDKSGIVTHAPSIWCLQHDIWSLYMFQLGRAYGTIG